MAKKKYEIQWWDDYHSADCLKRLDMVEKLPFVKEVISLCKYDKIPKKLRVHMVTTMLNSFFEDFESYMYERYDMKEKK